LPWHMTLWDVSRHTLQLCLLKEQRIRKGNKSEIWSRPRKHSCTYLLRIHWPTMRSVRMHCYPIYVRYSSLHMGTLIQLSVRCGSKCITNPLEMTSISCDYFHYNDTDILTLNMPKLVSSLDFKALILSLFNTSWFKNGKLSHDHVFWWKWVYPTVTISCNCLPIVSFHYNTGS
jgi:hypothetical protein